MSVLTPNGKVTNSASFLVLLGSLFLLAVVWIFNPSPLVPTPIEVGKAWSDLVHNGMFYQLYVSLTTNLQAIAISTGISLLAAYASVIPAARPFVAFLSKSRFFSMTGFVVVFTLMFGVGHGLKVALLVFGMSVFFITSMADVVSSIPREEYDHARTLRMSNWRIVWEVVVIGRADYALESLRQNAAIGWIMLTMVEGLCRSEGGIGAMMLNENKHFNMASVFAIQLSIFALGVLQDACFAWVKRTACPYSQITLERQ